MIKDFISQVKSRGLARTNRYEVVITFPNSVGGGIRAIANLFCDSVTLPGCNIATTPMRTFGEIREMPYERMYDSVTMSFYVDADMRIKKAFQGWMDLIHNPDTRTMGYYNDYTRPVQIYVTNVDDTTPYMLTLFEAYPKTINSHQLDTASREVMKMTLTMQYKYWNSNVISVAVPEQDIPVVGSGTRTSQGDPSSNWWSQGVYPGSTFDPPRSVFTEA